MTSYFKKKQQPQKKERKNKVPPRRKLYVNSPKGDQDREGWNIERSHKQRAFDIVISLWQSESELETTALWLTKRGWGRGGSGQKQAGWMVPSAAVETLIFEVCPFFQDSASVELSGDQQPQNTGYNFLQFVTCPLQALVRWFTLVFKLWMVAR